MPLSFVIACRPLSWCHTSCHRIPPLVIRYPPSSSLSRFDAYAEVSETWSRDAYDRRADKPWTRLTNADKVEATLDKANRTDCSSVLLACKLTHPSCLPADISNLIADAHSPRAERVQEGGDGRPPRLGALHPLPLSLCRACSLQSGLDSPCV